MSDLDTSRIPRDAIIGLLSEASTVDRERITARMPAQRLDELLGEDKPEDAHHEDDFEEALTDYSDPPIALGSTPELVVRFRAPRSHHIVIWSFTLTFLLGVLIFLLI